MDLDLKAMHVKGQDRGCVYRDIPVYCRPEGLPQLPCRLYRNNGDGAFIGVSEKSGILGVKPGYPVTAVAADFDGDGWPDIYVACDTSPSLLLRNNHDGTFREQALESDISLSEDGQVQAGMGLGIADFDTDGRLDILKTHFRKDTSGLYQNLGGGNFRDVTVRPGRGNAPCGLGRGIADLDNDGLPDLFSATGMVYPEVEKALPDTPYKTACVLFRNLGGGKFEELTSEAGPRVMELHSSRGVAFGDFNNDGDLDILIMNMNEAPSLLRNDISGAGHWLEVLLKGIRSNRSAIGAQVTATYGDRKQAQAVLAQSSYPSVNDKSKRSPT
jgi:enediyne biosynthesis protein E4